MIYRILNIIRLAYDEIFSYQLSLAILRNNLKKLRSNSFKLNPNKIIDYVKGLLPFSLIKIKKSFPRNYRRY